MDIFLNVLFLVIGMALLIKGADFFVSGASAVAKRFKIPAMFIGLTIVALGTSLPELSISLAGAIKNSVDMSVGNIVGSNMANMLLILGIVALIRPVPITKDSKKIDFPFMLGITLLLLLFSVDVVLNGASENIITRTESIIFVIILAIYLAILILNAKHKKAIETFEPKPIPVETNQPETKKPEKVMKVWQIILCIVFGLGAVVFGAECVSSTAKFLALKMGMSEALVGLTVVAIGTSLPELATSIAASIKGENQLALGNIIGSNVINISLILGIVGIITQVSVSTLIIVDILILAVSTIIVTLFCIFRKNVSRWIGAIFLTIYIAYLAFAIIRNYLF